MTWRGATTLVAMTACCGVGYAAGQAETSAAPGYIVAEIAVTDPVAYEAYKPKAAALVAQYGGRYLVRGGTASALEGAAPPGRVVVVEFPSVAQALKFYNSPAYRTVGQIRRDASISRFFVVGGLPRP